MTTPVRWLKAEMSVVWSLMDFRGGLGFEIGDDAVAGFVAVEGRRRGEPGRRTWAVSSSRMLGCWQVVMRLANTRSRLGSWAGA